MYRILLVPNNSEYCSTVICIFSKHVTYFIILLDLNLFEYFTYSVSTTDSCFVSYISFCEPRSSMRVV